MTKQICALMFVVVFSLPASTSLAATPMVTTYFDEALTIQNLGYLQPGTATVYIVAKNFDANLTAIEYKVDYPEGMTWIADLDMPPIKIGSTQEGIAQAWGGPIDGFSPVVIAKALVRWNPAESSGRGVAVKPYPPTGLVRATIAPDHRIVEATGDAPEQSTRPTPRASEPLLYDAQPNPFNPETRITYWIPSGAHVHLTVHDVSGRVVARLVDEKRDSGQHTVGWSAGDLPSGVYFLRLEVADFIQHKKVVLLK